MTAPLSAGVPSIAEYEQLLRSESFAALERFSDQFLTTHRTAIRPYARKWVPDPLHQWSRQWEYPFTVSRLSAVLGATHGATPTRILDAGSGVTFMPFFLTSTFDALDVYCCDWDASLGSIFNALNSHVDRPATFIPADLHALPFRSGYFDAVYSISVLEHTDRRPTIVRELRRVLKPGGKLVLTFDAAVRRARADPDGELDELLSALGDEFADDEPGGDDPRRALPQDLLTTTYMATVDRSLLPWRHPLVYRLSCLLSGHGWVDWPPPLTVVCMSMTKPLRGQ